MCDCAICHEEITTETGSTLLGCRHAFHLSCIVAWFCTQEGESTCPYCRYKVGEKDDIPDLRGDTHGGGEDTQDEDSEREDSEDDEDHEDTGMRPRFAHLLDDPRANVYVDYDSEEELTEDEFEWDAAGVQKTHWTRDPETGIWTRSLTPQPVNRWDPSARPAVPITLYYHVREIQRAWRGHTAREQVTMRRAAKTLLQLSF